ncbi:MAG: hypothetical protein ACRDRL_11395 [Sciscionella sp.]
MHEDAAPAQGTVRSRQLGSPAALALADLAAIFDDLAMVMACCERLLTFIASDATDSTDRLTLESLWTTALVSYVRCFESGERGKGLVESDLSETGLTGDVLDWHKLLIGLRRHYVEGAVNPREVYSVGVAVTDDGTADGVVVSSTTHPQVDEVAVRQTGRLAFELSRLIDGRITDQQATVYNTAKSMTAQELSALPLVEVAGSSSGGGSAGPD